MKGNPGEIEEDALNHINAMISDVIKELNWDLMKPDDNVPMCCKKPTFDINRLFHHGYKYRDGYNVSNIEIKSFVIRKPPSTRAFLVTSQIYKKLVLCLSVLVSWCSWISLMRIFIMEIFLV
jgi:hypothetical protein